MAHYQVAPLDALETPKTFTLLAPVQAGDREVTEITLSEPTAGDIEQLVKDEAKEGGATAMIKLIAKQTKLAPVDARKIGARDFKILSEYLGGFLSETKES